MIAVPEEKLEQFKRMQSALQKIVRLCQDPRTPERFISSVELSDMVEEIARGALNGRG